MLFQIVKGNILNIIADAIVLPANRALSEGSGVSKAIFEAAGRKQLTEICQKKAPCEEGGAVATSAFDLDAEIIIHAVVPKWEDGFHDEYSRLYSAYITALTTAENMGCESISIPLLGSGNNGFDWEAAFKIAIQAIKQFDGEKLKNVTLVVFSEKIARFANANGFVYTEVSDAYNQHAKKHQIDRKAIADNLAKFGEFFRDKEKIDGIVYAAKQIIDIIIKFK